MARFNIRLTKIFLGLFLCFVLCISRFTDGQGTIRNALPVSVEPQIVNLYLQAKDVNTEGFIAVRGSDNVVERKYVPKSGLQYSVGKDEIDIRYINKISENKKPLWHGMLKLGGVVKDGSKMVVMLKPQEGRIVTIKALGEDGIPLVNTTLEVCELWHNQAIDTSNITTDEAGVANAYLGEEGVYKIRAELKGFAARAESPGFIPKEIKTPEFTFIALPPKDFGFIIRLVIAEGGMKRQVKDIELLEASTPGKNIMLGGYAGKIRVRLGIEQESFSVGDKISLRLPMEASRKYRIVQPIIKVGNFGESVDVEVAPIPKDSKVDWDVTREDGALVTGDVALYIKGDSDKEWIHVEAKKTWACSKGKYSILAFVYGYRIYHREIEVTRERQVIPLRLSTADKCHVLVDVDKSGQPDVSTRVVYSKSIPEKLENRLVLKNGQGDIYFDGTQSEVGLLLYSDGCGPLLVPLKQEMVDYRVTLKSTPPIAVTVEHNDVVKQIDEQLLKNVQIVSIKPWRQVIASTINGGVILNSGQYLPVIDLTVKEGPAHLIGKVVECETVKVEDGTKSLTLQPRRIVPMGDVLKAESSK